ncbi:MAG: DUF423 domain-containing protein [Pseudomonadales bacterium]
MANPYLIAGGCFGLTGVLFGALGAHSIAQRLSETALGTWQTAVLYQLVHALVLVSIGLFLAFSRRQRKRAYNSSDVAADPDGRKRARAKAMAHQARALKIAGLALVLGIILFSGSLYLLALGGPTLLGPVTPIGGLSFMVGWLAIIVAGSIRIND